LSKNLKGKVYLMLVKANPKTRANEIILQELDKELLIYDLESNKAYCLNETLALVWQMCDGNKSVSEISQLITKKLKSTVGEDFVWLAIEQLKKENLLENSTEIVVDFNGLSRREMIRKVGLASMIALPVIASLVAPTSAMAQSAGCQSTGQSCTFNNYTQSNCCDDLRCDSDIGSTCRFCLPSAVQFAIVNVPVLDTTGCPAACQSSSRKNLCCDSGTGSSFYFGLGNCSCSCP
jgi:hypothetical protein